MRVVLEDHPRYQNQENYEVAMFDQAGQLLGMLNEFGRYRAGMSWREGYSYKAARKALSSARRRDKEHVFAVIQKRSTSTAVVWSLPHQKPLSLTQLERKLDSHHGRATSLNRSATSASSGRTSRRASSRRS